jgi:hypothetical protein
MGWQIDPIYWTGGIKFYATFDYILLCFTSSWDRHETNYYIVYAPKFTNVIFFYSRHNEGFLSQHEKSVVSFRPEKSRIMHVGG